MAISLCLRFVLGLRFLIPYQQDFLDFLALHFGNYYLQVLIAQLFVAARYVSQQTEDETGNGLVFFIFGEMSVGLGLGVSVLSLAFTIFMTMLELLVALIQAYVFTLLSAIYFGMATEEHH